jgi:hypothetical protein
MSDFTYYFHNSITGSRQMIVRSDLMWIPTDPANTDYQQYLAWLEEGNVPEEWNPALEGN